MFFSHLFHLIFCSLVFYNFTCLSLRSDDSSIKCEEILLNQYRMAIAMMKLMIIIDVNNLVFFFLIQSIVLVESSLSFDSSFNVDYHLLTSPFSSILILYYQNHIYEEWRVFHTFIFHSCSFGSISWNVFSLPIVFHSPFVHLHF